MRGVGRAVFAAVLLLIAGTLDIIYGIAAVGMLISSTTRSTCFEPPHLGMDHDHRRRNSAHRRVLAVRRRNLRPRDRDHCRQHWRSRVAAVDRRSAPMVVVGHLRAVHLRPVRPDRLRRGNVDGSLAACGRGGCRWAGSRLLAHAHSSRLLSWCQGVIWVAYCG